MYFKNFYICALDRAHFLSATGLVWQACFFKKDGV